MAARFSGTPPMVAVGLTSLGSKFVFPELCGQVQGDVSTRRGKDASLACQVSEFFFLQTGTILSRSIRITRITLYRSLRIILLRSIRIHFLFFFLCLGLHYVRGRRSDDRRVPGRRCPR